ncbi:serine hydrolase domain-containing protein [Deinococcus aestuarii]|uniref:serine hydrolase domain-containing protein n=1 Tax=Deinococcus aestuarii TaxID=2774531 RepID=UPI001C0CDF28
MNTFVTQTIPDALVPLHRDLQLRAQRDDFSGVVLVDHQGDTLFQQSYGWAQRGSRTPNTLDTCFNLASISKCFTAIGVLQLAQRGLLAFEDPVSRFLPEWPQPVGHQITVHHLLTHQAGLPALSPEDWRNNDRTVGGIVARLRQLPHADEPGTLVDYSNSAYILLAGLLERVSGQDYFTYLARNVFEPAGMNHTRFPDLDLDPPETAFGYVHRDADGRPNPDAPLRMVLGSAGWKAMGSHGAYGTAHDLVQFTRALLDQRLLAPELTRLALEGKVDFQLPPFPQCRYGYGFIERSRGPEGWRGVGHTGGGLGVSDEVVVFPEQRMTVVVLGNFDSSNAWEVVDQVVEALATP